MRQDDVRQLDPSYYEENLLLKIAVLNKSAPTPVNAAVVQQAIDYAKQYHQGQTRQTGEPYYTHPLAVAIMVCDYLFETDAIVTSILHDTLEDTSLTYAMIEEVFGADIAFQVEAITRIKPSGKISSAEILKRFWNDKQYKLILIKLFDRLHNMQTIFAKSPEKQAKIVRETLEYFLALGEILELPHLGDMLYQQCYETNKVLGLIQSSELQLDQEVKLADLLASENN
jgi:(p)ppGpp synthase/HD superfamily hydrolase